MTTTGAAGAGFRGRLLRALAEGIAEDGYRRTTVADVVRRARTSRRTFYEHFADKEACYARLLAEANQRIIVRITEAVDPRAPWEEQVRQAVGAWLDAAGTTPELTLSWIRDLPSLGAAARALEREVTDHFVVMVQRLCDTEELRAAGLRPVDKQWATILIGGLRELMATAVEEGRGLDTLAEPAAEAVIALLGPRR
ncbi:MULTISPECIES: TetR/AcrR family transcriptional regulator [Actinosynnema]|uniref:TetR family transcriptional regulator n=1 Tax=Actinosynnema pretiosum TaxID=42197 RepID=A0A290Z564_9PSEU|nr:TetR/AcrR family transcriptional regulator [Actinosynnema pretiosum]ATE54160.1 TetR family transcriptional regulator [Actinosynnema pretiosum]